MTSPDPARCRKAIKLLREYERLMRKYGKQLPAKRLAELNALRDAEEITSNDLPARLRSEFPSEFTGMTLADVRSRCGMLKS